MLTGEPLVPEEKAADDGIMLSWLIAMSGGRIPLDLSLKSKLRAKYFDENGTHILYYLIFPDRLLLYRVIQTGDTRGDTGKSDHCKWRSRSSR